jgi:hypothetical protein
LYTDYAKVFVLARFVLRLPASSTNVLCAILLLSISVTPTILGMSCCQIYAIAQLGEVGDSASNLSSDQRPVANASRASELSTDGPQFLNYSNAIYGIKLKYPSNWNIVLPESIGSGHNDTTSINKDLQLIAKFSSPTHDNVTINIDRLLEGPKNPVSIKQYVNNILNNSRNAFGEYRLLDLRISSDTGLNFTMNNSDLDAFTGPVIYNLTYSADQIDGDDRSHIRGMDIGAITNRTAYDISYRSTVENYDIYLPEVLEMIYSFEISDLNELTSSKSSSSQALQSSPGLSSNASTASREQNTVIESEAENASPSGTNNTPDPSAGTQQTTPNYYPSPNVATESAYPTTQLYPPGYSPYPPGYSGYADNSLYPPGYSGYPPYAGYPPYIGIDPVIPTTPVIPPFDYTDPTILSYNTYNDTAGVFHVVGEVENSSPYLITSVQVIAAFYDNFNQLLSVKFANTNPPSIRSGQVAFFDLTIPPGTIPVDEVSQWTLRLVWQ